MNKTRQNNNISFHAALYLRLSRDDELAGESSSISTQREITSRYARDNGFEIAGEYIDDGFSGTNFDRPDFRRMIADIEAGKVNCVITKDLSRLGRNSARTADYLDEWFPSHAVRYISVTDGYDSFNLTDGRAMTTPLILAVHEMYARDISGKIRSSFNAKMEAGKYVGAKAPYGYQKDSENKNHLVVDEDAASVVRRIFFMALMGESPHSIADTLNREGVPSPAVYRCQKNPALNVDDFSERKEWTSSIVCKLLRNEVYLGKLQQGKTQKVSFKSKDMLNIPRDEWITVEGTHEAIISEDVFRKVRSRCVARRSPATKGFHNIFSGIAVCADCGRNMTTAPSRRKGSIYNLTCGGYKSYGAKECSNHFIDYEVLWNAVSRDLQNWLRLTDEQRENLAHELAAEKAHHNGEDEENSRQRLSEKQRRRDELSVVLSKMYEDYALGRIPETTFQLLSRSKSEELQRLEDEIKIIEKRLSIDDTDSDSWRQFFDLLAEAETEEGLTRELLVHLIDRIEVEQGKVQRGADGKQKRIQRIRIYYRFIGCPSGEGGMYL